MNRLLITLILLIVGMASGHARPGMGNDDGPGSENWPARVSVVTFYPGNDIYELEGHSALRITTPYSDMAVSYGMFDFNAPFFVYRFVKGETDYMVGVIDWREFEYAYTSAGRRIVEQVIDLTDEEKDRLFSLIKENLEPENRSYRYNYVRDNCATRPLRIIEKAVGDSIVLGRPGEDVERLGSWRDIMRRYHRNYPWYQLGIDLALGSGIDRPISNREKAFAPVVMADQLETAVTAGGRRLVSETKVINDTDPEAGIMGKTPFVASPLFVMSVIFAVVLLITVNDLRRKRVSRWLDGVLFGIYGIMGCVTAFLVFVSEHEATSPNYLIWWLNPLCLVAAIGVFIKKAQKLVMWYQIVNFAVLTGLCVAWPMLPQSGNPAFIPMIGAEMLRSASFVIITLKTSNRTIVSKKNKKRK